MAKQSYLLPTGDGRLPDSPKLGGETRCPKCLGVGALALMAGRALAGAVETCPTCHGRGLVPRQNGCCDLTPAQRVGCVG